MSVAVLCRNWTLFLVCVQTAVSLTLHVHKDPYLLITNHMIIMFTLASMAHGVQICVVSHMHIYIIQWENANWWSPCPDHFMWHISEQWSIRIVASLESRLFSCHNELEWQYFCLKSREPNSKSLVCHKHHDYRNVRVYDIPIQAHLYDCEASLEDLVS